MVCVRNFPHDEVSVKVGVMEFGLKQTDLHKLHVCHHHMERIKALLLDDNQITLFATY